jgi:hypothetical protein
MSPERSVKGRSERTLPLSYRFSDVFGFLLVQGMTAFRICDETQLSLPDHPPHLASFDRRH